MRIGFVRVSALLAGIMLAPASWAAARHATVDLHGERQGADLSSTVAHIGDVPEHDFVQRVYNYRITSKNADFNDLMSTNFAQTETTAGTGTHRGYGIWKNAAGDTITLKFEGTHRPVPGADGQAVYNGHFEFSGGTGKFKDIHGSSTYAGRITPTSQVWDATIDVDY
jgi:hypothetical protein